MHLHHAELAEPFSADGFVPRAAALRPNDYLSPDVIVGPIRASGTSEPRWIDASPAGRAALPGVGQRPLFPESGTLPTWTKVVSGLGLMGMLYTLDHWARPTLKASKLQQRDGLWGLFQRVIDTLQGFLDHGTNQIGHEVSKGAAHAAHGPAYTIGLGADRWNQLVWNLTYSQLGNEQATRRLVHHVIPREINRKVNPVRTQVRQTRTTVRKHGAEITTIRRYITTTIERHLKPEIRHIHTTVTRTLPARITRVERTVRKTQVRQQRDHRLVMKLISLLTVTGAVGLVLKAFGRLGLNFLRCQNVKDFGNTLCPAPPGSGRGLGRFGRSFGSLLGELAALTFVPFLLTDACRIVGLIEDMAIRAQPAIDALVLGIEGFVCGGVENLPSAIEASDLRRAPALPTGL